MTKRIVITLRAKVDKENIGEVVTLIKERVGKTIPMNIRIVESKKLKKVV